MNAALLYWRDAVIELLRQKDISLHRELWGIETRFAYDSLLGPDSRIPFSTLEHLGKIECDT